MQNEAMHCLALGIIDSLTRNPQRYGSTFYLLSVEDDGGLKGVAWMTPPHPLGLSAMPTAAVDALVDFAETLEHPLPGVGGPRPTADEFKERWLARTGASVQSGVDQRIYRLERVSPPRDAGGAIRVATLAHEDLLTEWSLGFVRDCGLSGNTDVRQNVVAGLTEGSRVFWELEGQPVAMAAFGGATPSGVRVNWVYTPPELRGRGYATALVAALSQRLLDEGRKFCFLYTDLANPTSNSIYQRIGYEPVCDSVHYTFTVPNDA